MSVGQPTTTGAAPTDSWTAIAVELKEELRKRKLRRGVRAGSTRERQSDFAPAELIARSSRCFLPLRQDAGRD